MAETGPQGNARVLKHDYRYAVSDEWIEHRINETGIEPPKFWRIEFALRELPDADARMRARRLREMWSRLPGDLLLEQPTEDPEEFLDLLEEWIEGWGGDLEPVSGEESEEFRHRRRLAEFDVEMDRWIEEHGSERLKLARSRNYKITSSYARDRALEELPECWIDTAGDGAFRERVDPSMRALQVETNFREWIEANELGLDTRVVWLTRPPSSMVEFLEYENDGFFDVASDFDQQEALLVVDYLGKYRAFLPIDAEQRSPRADDPYWADDDEEEDI